TQALWKNDGTRYANAQPNAGDGAVINIPTFNLLHFHPGDIPTGDYKLGLACWNTNTATLDKYWVGDMHVTADSNDPGQAQVSWPATRGGGGTPTSTSTTPSTTTSGPTTTSTSTTLVGGPTTTPSTTLATTTTTSHANQATTTSTTIATAAGASGLGRTGT